jgi:hypothetical protein
MNYPKHLFLGAGLALALLGLNSCGNMKSGAAKTSFSFDPPVTQPTNRAAVKVKISTGAQRLYVVEGDKVLLATPCSVGKPGSVTPGGNHRITGKTKFRRRVSSPGAGYPMTYWMSFYRPAYGMHWGFIKPYPTTAGCVRLPLNSARKVFDLVQVGTPLNVSASQPWDATIGAKLPVLDDSSLSNPPDSYMKSAQVFQDQEKGKMWNF